MQAGRVAFAANLVGPTAGVDSTNNRGIWSNGNGVTELIALQGIYKHPDSALGEVFDVFVAPTINHSGHVAFVGTARGAGSLGFYLHQWSLDLIVMDRFRWWRVGRNAGIRGSRRREFSRNE